MEVKLNNVCVEWNGNVIFDTYCRYIPQLSVAFTGIS